MEQDFELAQALYEHLARHNDQATSGRSQVPGDSGSVSKGSTGWLRN